MKPHAAPKARFWETPEFAALQREWRGKLRDSGFKDQETATGGRLQLPHSSNGDLERLSRPDAATKGAYFTLAGRWLHAKVWPRRLNRRLWELHAEGVGTRMATVLLMPSVTNTKALNELRIWAEREEMARWLGTDEMIGSEEAGEQPRSLWAEAMLAEGFEPAGYLKSSEGTAASPWRR